MNRFILLLLVCCLGPVYRLLAQNERAVIAESFIQARAYEWGLLPADIADLKVSDQYYDDKIETEHIYFQQQIHGIAVYNALFNVHIKDGKVVHYGNRLLSNVHTMIAVSSPSISAQEALQSCMADLKFENRILPQVQQIISAHHLVFQKGDLSHSDIRAKVIYELNDVNGLDLVWEIMFDAVNGSDYWRYSIDAVTGKMLRKKSITIHCQFPSHQHDGCDDMPSILDSGALAPPPNGDGAKYQAFKFPIESPIHGTRSIIVDPADPIASPFGWHDTTGVAGAEFTITRGNNVHAYLDTNGDNKSDGGEPNGGPTLEFLAPFTYTAEPDSINKAAVINLFYVNNFMHDFAYAHGFTEKAGNFQQNNYGKGGIGNDFVFAEAQDNAKASTPSLNNANFNTLPDGQGSRMQMFLWNSTSSKVFSVTAPENIKAFYECSPAGWGKPIDNVPLNLEMAIAFDASNTLCCGTITADVKDKMAIIDRGTCQFGEKALNAQKAGAKAVCICNFEEALLTMGAGTSGGLVTIPVIMLKKQSCDRIREQLLAGKKVSSTLVLPADVSGPKLIDGDFDNGIIAHEYAHGISNRLTGGPANTGCLANAEQMGEGWSDFFSLVTTARKGQNGSEALGIGTYALRQEVTGGGIRAFRYSTDMGINPNVYDDIIGVGEHRLGEVWASCLWDMYWEMVKLYGFDEDLINGNGGNNRTVRLVTEGMKLQPCSPGFVDGRDAIIAADKLLYNGVHECLIWKVFARRGLGYLANQGSSSSTTDGKMNFEVLPACIKEIKIVKVATPVIDGGQEISYTLKITNDKGIEANNVIVTDELPVNATYVSGSGSVPGTVTGSMVSFNLGKLAVGGVKEITYKVISDKRKSVRSFFDDMENGESNWDYASLNDSLGVWQMQQTEKKSGNNAWKVPNLATAQDQVLQFFPDVKIVGNNPAMRFWHLYSTESGNDGGFIQISTDGGKKWEDLGTRTFRNNYRGKMNFTTFAAPNVSAWWGNSGSWIESFVDLKEYGGKTVNIRFRFGSNNGVGGNGWYLDDVELFDMVNYNMEACVTTSEGDKSCAVAAGYGTVVNTGINVSNDDQLESNRITVFPNPSTDLINIKIAGERPSNISLELLGMDGKVVLSKHFSQPSNLIPIDLSNLHAGLYYLRSVIDGRRLATKVVKF